MESFSSDIMFAISNGKYVTLKYTFLHWVSIFVLRFCIALVTQSRITLWDKNSTGTTITGAVKTIEIDTPKPHDMCFISIFRNRALYMQNSLDRNLLNFVNMRKRISEKSNEKDFVIFLINI